MIEWLLNFGTGLPAWTDFVLIGATIMLGVWIVLGVVALVKNLDDWKPKCISLALKLLIFAAFCWAFYTAFGPGTAPDVLDSDTGVMEMVDKAPDQKPTEQIEKEAYEKKDIFLKKQDQGFEEEQAEADAYLEKLRREHQN